MPPSKNIELARIEASTEKFHAVCSRIKHLFSVVAAVVAVHLMLQGIRPFFESSPETISAMSNFVDKLNFSNITGYVLSGIFGAGWLIERRGRKKAIAAKNQKLKQTCEGRND